MKCYSCNSISMHASLSAYLNHRGICADSDGLNATSHASPRIRVKAHRYGFNPRWFAVIVAFVFVSVFPICCHCRLGDRSSHARLQQNEHPLHVDHGKGIPGEGWEDTGFEKNLDVHLDLDVSSSRALSFSSSNRTTDANITSATNISSIQKKFNISENSDKITHKQNYSTFAPTLGCNADLDEDPCDTTWSSMFGNRYTKTIVIPCGRCIVMDYTEDEFNVDPDDSTTGNSFSQNKLPRMFLEAGLDIQGKLVFPKGYRLELIITRNILVQGELIFESSLAEPAQRIDRPGMPADIVITLQEPEEQEKQEEQQEQQQLRQASELSPPTFYPFVVTGGKVMILDDERHHEDDCDIDAAKWIVLENYDPASLSCLGCNDDDDSGTLYVQSSTHTVHSTNQTRCPLKTSNKFVIHQRFGLNGSLAIEGPSQDGRDQINTTVAPIVPFATTGSSTGHLQSHTFVSEDSFKAINRKSPQDGIRIDLTDYEACWEPDETYIVTARVRMTHRNTNDDYRHPVSMNATSCEESGKDCLTLSLITSSYNDDNNQLRMRQKPNYSTSTIWKENPSNQATFGLVLTIATTVVFGETELVSSKPRSDIAGFVLQRSPSTSHSMLLNGVPTDVDVELLEFTLQEPPVDAYPSFDLSNAAQQCYRDQSGGVHCDRIACTDLVPSNGDAERAGWSPYPFETNNPYTHVVVARDSDMPSDLSLSRTSKVSSPTGPERLNSFFRVTGREFSIKAFNPDDDNWNEAGLSWDVPKVCFQAATSKNDDSTEQLEYNPSIGTSGTLRSYRIQAHIRIHPNISWPSNSPIRMEIFLRAHHRRPRQVPELVYHSLVACPPCPFGIWVHCDGEFHFDPIHFVTDDVLRYDIVFETRETYLVDYDVDNLSFELQPSTL